MDTISVAPQDGGPAMPRPIEDIDLVEADIKQAYLNLADRKQEAAKDAISRTLELGTLLIVAKNRLPHGGFLKWLKRTMPFTPRWAQAAMKLARHRAFVEESIGRKCELGSLPSIAKIIAAIKEREKSRPANEDHSVESRRPRHSGTSKVAFKPEPTPVQDAELARVKIKSMHTSPPAQNRSDPAAGTGPSLATRMTEAFNALAATYAENCVKPAGKICPSNMGVPTETAEEQHGSTP